jgi:hypothetical protein
MKIYHRYMYVIRVTEHKRDQIRLASLMKNKYHLICMCGSFFQQISLILLQYLM